MKAFFDSYGRPKVKLAIRGTRQSGTLEAILDTGFDGFLSLPVATAVPLGLELIGIQPVEYADGRVSKELVFAVKVNLNAKEKVVSATLTGGSEALAGTGLFGDYDLKLNFSKQIISMEKIK
jgi:predicted aspartyl protease